MQIKKSGKAVMYVGIFQFLWAEIKTLNLVKLSSLNKILKGYFQMKFNERKKISKV